MKKRLVLLLLLLAVALSGCHRRPLVRPVADLSLRLKLRLDVKVNGRDTILPLPEMMRVMFFNDDDLRFKTESYLPAHGGPVSIAPGEYKFMAYNFDTQSTLVRGDRDYSTVEAYTNAVTEATRSSLLDAIRYSRMTKADDISKALSELESHPIVYEPDYMFVARKGVEVFDRDEEQVIEAEAENIVETWKVIVRIRNGKYMSSAKALVTGQSASNFISLPVREGRTDTDVTILFGMEGATDDSSNEILTGTFNTFGKNPSVGSTLWLTITLKDGETVKWSRVITDEFYTPLALEKQIILIDEEIIDIPKPKTPDGSGGFQPGVDDWDEEHHHIDV